MTLVTADAVAKCRYCGDDRLAVVTQVAAQSLEYSTLFVNLITPLFGDFCKVPVGIDLRTCLESTLKC